MVQEVTTGFRKLMQRMQSKLNGPGSDHWVSKAYVEIAKQIKWPREFQI